MKAMDIALLTLLSLFALHDVIDAEYCYRRIHGPDNSQPGSMACRGMIEKRTFDSSRACCESDGKAYSRELITLGKRGKKWRCVPCPVDTLPPVIVSGTGWSDWSQWTDCSVTCSTGFRTRRRLCQDEDPDDCEGEEEMMEPCSDMPRCPVDGRWGPWRSWTECSEPCAGGVTLRTRICNNPPPKYNGKECPGDVEEAKACNSHDCPVDGAWSEWSANNTCSVSCGAGRLTRRRECNNPSPQHGGKECVGRSEFTERCDTGVKCPIDGQWSLWSKYSMCSVTCGEGSRLRTRQCVAPRPRNGGRDCVGEPANSQLCYSHYPCPVDGSWSDWGSWGTCLAKPCRNETGLQTRRRTCSAPLPRYRGKMCAGATTDTQTCYNNENCPVNGEWCDWQSYSECTNVQRPFKTRIRDCHCPTPNNGGSTCMGTDFEVVDCEGGVEMKENPNTRCRVLEGSGEMPDDEDC